MTEGKRIAYGRIEYFNLSFTSRETSIVTFKAIPSGKVYGLVWGNIYKSIAGTLMADMARLSIHKDESGEVVDDVLLEGDYVSGNLCCEEPDGLVVKFTVCGRTYIASTTELAALPLRRGTPIEVREVKE